MSIVELLKSVDILARAIAEKTKELEDLKKVYEEKLETINAYILNVQESILLQDQDEIDDDHFISQITEPIRCTKCNTEVYGNTLDSKFILVPKSKLKNIIPKQMKPEVKIPNVEKLTLSSSTDSEKLTRNHHYSKSKKTCSYCKKAGHSRAKCLTRLSTPSSDGS